MSWGMLSMQDDNPDYFLELATKKDSQYSTLSDRIVIQGIEQQTALALGEISLGQVTRFSHKGYSGPDLRNLSVEHQSSYCAWENNMLPSVKPSALLFDKAKQLTK